MTEAVAERDGDRWRLYGRKWFASNAGADITLVLARFPDGEQASTRGVGLFMMPRRKPDGSLNDYRIERLKEKLGTRSMASGEITLDDLLIDSFRFILSRTIVGEVRGREILSMIKAMQSTSGSISTTHAANAKAAIRKLITCAMEAGNHISEGYATSAVAGHIDLIVQVNLETTPVTEAGGRRKRWISEIVSVEPGEQATGYATQQVFRPAQGGPAVASVMPEHIRTALEAQGFDTRAFEAERRSHGGPAA